MNKEEWLKARKNLLTASDVAAVLGVSPHGGPLSVYASKVLEDATPETIAMKMGKAVEPIIAEAYTEKFNVTLHDPGEFTIQQHPDIPWIGATLDRVNDSNEPVELKHVGNPMLRASDWDTDPPDHYQVQLQIQMACIQAVKGTLVGSFPGYDIRACDLDREEAFLTAAYPILEQFWDRVKRRDPPAADARPNTADLVKRLYPDENQMTVLLGEDGQRLYHLWIKARQDCKEAETARREYSTKLRAMIRDNTFAQFPDGSRVSLKTTKRKGYTRVVEASAYRVLRPMKAVEQVG